MMTSTLTIAHITQKQIQRLQHIQNCTVPLINPPEKEDYITPCLIKLRWLPIHARITFKIIVLT